MKYKRFRNKKIMIYFQKRCKKVFKMSTELRITHSRLLVRKSMIEPNQPIRAANPE